MVQLTVGYVAGFIAAANFLAHLWSPNINTFVLSGLLRDKNTAATWTVAGRAFQRSQWPLIFRADSFYKHGVPKKIAFLLRFTSLMTGVIVITGVVTPLGLYDALEAGSSVQTPFRYLPDLSSFGLGTPPRSNYSFTRLCSTSYVYFQPLWPCPFTDTEVVTTSDANGTVDYKFPYGYNLDIPDRLINTYSSGTGNNTTVSNFFDIQWRQYLTTSKPNAPNVIGYNNGSTYLVGSFRNMESIVLSNAYQPVEGLIVDSINGGIGFRNHTVPTRFQYGVTWDEDLLFIEPETVCVDTNLTIDFQISNSPNSTTMVENLVLTDRGGFANLIRSWPEVDLSNPQNDSDLYGRAYKAAWLNNAYTMLYYNVTTDNNATTGEKAFAYLDSFVGKTYELQPSTLTSTYNSLMISDTFGDYLNIEDSTGPSSVGISPADSGPATNPFGVNGTTLDGIMTLCVTAGGADFANVTNIYISCGLMHGIPQRQDEGSRLVFDSGSRWSQPLYSCASAVKAVKKTVSFNYNGTNDALSDLDVTNIQTKIYLSPNDIPLWGVENTGNSYTNEGINLIWGLINSDYANDPNVSVVNQEALYLPGYLDIFGTGQQALDSDNLPGSQFYIGSMSAAYSVGSDPGLTTVDYSGQINMAMWAHWQNLTQTASTAGLIPNLIWTDNAASAVVGTKGVLGPMNAASENVVPLFVTPKVSKVKYRWRFAIPALVAAVGLCFVTLLAILVVLSGRGSFKRLALHLKQVSPGRIYTTFLYAEPEAMAAKSKDWNRKMGKVMVDLSGKFPEGSEAISNPEKGNLTPQVTEYNSGGTDEGWNQNENDQFLASGHNFENSQGDIGYEQVLGRRNSSRL